MVDADTKRQGAILTLALFSVGSYFLAYGCLYAGYADAEYRHADGTVVDCSKPDINDTICDGVSPALARSWARHPLTHPRAPIVQGRRVLRHRRRPARHVGRVLLVLLHQVLRAERQSRAIDGA